MGKDTQDTCLLGFDGVQVPTLKNISECAQCLGECVCVHMVHINDNKICTTTTTTTATTTTTTITRSL
jgi:hypothetical protein